MTHFLHTQADLEAALAQLILADPRLAPVAEKAGAFCLAPARGRLCRPVRHRLRAAAVDRERGGHPQPAVRRLRSVSITTRCAARAPTSSSGSACRRPRSRRSARSAKPLAKGHIDLGAVGNMAADDAHAKLTALHGVGPWTADIYLLFCLGHADAFPAGDLAVQEAARIALQSAQAAGRQAAHQDCRSLAALARCGGASALGLLSRGEEARRGAGSAASEQAESDEKGKSEMAELDGPNLDGPSIEPRSGKRNNLSSSCTAMAPTATT